MSPVKNLRTLAYRLAPDTAEMPFRFATLQFPNRWSGMIADLVSAGQRLKQYKFRARTKSLTQLPLALFSQLITVKPHYYKSPWLYSASEIKAEHLQMVFYSWLKAEYEGIELPLPYGLDEQIYQEPLVWQQEERDLAEITLNEWGTANPKHPESFDLFPELLADGLSRQGLRLDFHSQPLEFRRAPGPASGNGIELISWPPLKFRNCAYSIYIRFTLQTVAFQSFPIVHCDMGIHRWVSANDARLGGGNHSVYLLTGIPGVSAPPHTRRFQVASVHWKRNNGSGPANGHRLFQLLWNDLLPELFQNLHPNNTLPSPEDLRCNPLAFMDGQNLSAAIAFHNTMPAREHQVQQGLTPLDRSFLSEQIAEHLKQKFNLVYVDAPQRMNGRAVSLSKNVFFPSSAQKSKAAKKVASDQREVLSITAGSNLRFEIWYQSSTVRNAVISNIIQSFGLKKPGKDFRLKGYYSCSTPEISIEVQAYQLGDLANPLDSSSRKERQTSVWRRAEDVVRAVGNAATNVKQEGLPIAAFVELAHADEFTEESDPKVALRAGFAKVGRITQFITPREDELTHRTKMSLLDLLRQVGVQSGLPKCLPVAFPRPVSYAAIWMYKPYEDVKSFLPMMLHMSGDGSVVKATAYGLGKFLPYSEFLRQLAERGKTKTINNQERNKVPGLLKQWLDEISDGSDILLLAHAQNTREVWGWLTNSQIAIDKLSFGNTDQSRSISEWPGVRVVRVRDCKGSETPECFAQKDQGDDCTNREEKMSFTQGLFRVSDRVFHSMTGKPKQRMKLSRKASKALKPDLQAWNARLVELTVACIQEGDEPWHWAKLTDKLRLAAVHSDDPMTLPLPLHLLFMAKQYAEIGVENF